MFDSSAPTAAMMPIMTTMTPALVATAPMPRRMPARYAIDDRKHPAQRPADGLAQKGGEREREHAEPQVPLVIERKIAIAEIAVRRQVEQQQPTESGRHHQSGISDPRRNRLRARWQTIPQPRGCGERNGRRGDKTDDVRCGPIEEAPAARAGSNPRSEPSGHGTRPIHAASAHARSASAAPVNAKPRRLDSLSSASPATIHPAHCHPAVRSSSRIASSFAACKRVSRASFMTAAALGQRVGEREPAAAALGNARLGRKERGARQRLRRAVTVERRAEQQQRIRLCAVAALERLRVGSREARLHHLESAGDRQRLAAVAAAERVALDVGLDLGVDRLDRAVERKEIAQAFALLQPQIAAPPLGFGKRTLERSTDLGVRVDDRQRYRGRRDGRGRLRRCDGKDDRGRAARQARRDSHRDREGRGRADRRSRWQHRRSGRRVLHHCPRGARTAEGARRSPRSQAAIRSATAIGMLTSRSQDEAGRPPRSLSPCAAPRLPQAGEAQPLRRADMSSRSTARSRQHKKESLPTVAARCCYKLLQRRTRSRFSRPCSRSSDRNNCTMRCQGDPSALSHADRKVGATMRVATHSTRFA